MNLSAFSAEFLWLDFFVSFAFARLSLNGNILTYILQRLHIFAESHQIVKRQIERIQLVVDVEQLVNDE